MSREHTITLRLYEATNEQLRVALADAEESARRCDAQGGLAGIFHTWHNRADAIRRLLKARAEQEPTGGEG